MLMLRCLLLAASGGMAMRQLEDGKTEDAMDLEEASIDWSSIPTPRASETLEFEGFEPSAVLEETEEVNKCDESYEKTGKVLGKGAFGKVYEVKKKTGRKWNFKKTYSDINFALKIPSKGDEKELMKEMAIMGNMQCENVLPLVQPKPCVDGRVLQTALVTKLMSMDLSQWEKHVGKYTVKKCYQKVRRQVVDGLNCMHQSGYIHNDIKANNILFESLDEDSCPVGLDLADFGNSYKIGDPMSLFDASFYEPCWYVAGSLFRGGEDTLGIHHTAKTRSGRTFDVPVADPKVDWCSWSVLAYYTFGQRDTAVQEQIGKGVCGGMGPGRKKSFP